MIGGDNSDTGYFRVVEGCLASDRDGMMSRHPHIHEGIKKLLAQWAYKILTGGGMKMPGRMLIDDGYLAVEDGQLFSGSDWIPYDSSISDLPGDRNLCVRYPVRMAEDLLPMNNLSPEAAINCLVENQGLSRTLAENIHATQLALHGTYTLHAERAKTVGGDYDGDCVAVITSKEYPMFVDYRFGMSEWEQAVEKTKAKRQRSSMMNLCSISFKAMGNEVGSITNAMSSAVAAGRLNLSRLLVPELQNEIDSLKHNTHADMKLVQQILEQVGKAAWLDIDKKLMSVDHLPRFVQPLSDSDVVARMYNVLYTDLMEVIGEALPIANFSGLFDGLLNSKKTPSKLVLFECRRINEFFGSTMSQGFTWLQLKKTALDAAKTEVKEARKGKDKIEIMVAYARLREAEASFVEATRTHRVLTSAVRRCIGVWGNGKASDDQMVWAAALHHVISGGTGKGSILYHAFPQQFADAVAAQTGGERVLVDETVEDYMMVLNSTGDQLIQVNPDKTWKPLYQRIEKQETTADGATRTVRNWKRVSCEVPVVMTEADEYLDYFNMLAA
jgi:hypothetical protein